MIWHTRVDKVKYTGLMAPLYVGSFVREQRTTWDQANQAFHPEGRETVSSAPAFGSVGMASLENHIDCLLE